MSPHKVNFFIKNQINRQAFAFLATANQHDNMNIVENRRKRLCKWFADKPIPQKEKSFLSQLMGGKASFGEKAARRIKRDYSMPFGYLDSNHQDCGSEMDVRENRAY